ncbi:MAG: PTS sugar transporter subunit IIC [Erysipelotrichaceae bacterium]|nr:PTS sugar transporter subunit IIC [Erysipelotrichaceae bacterium]
MKKTNNIIIQSLNGLAYGYFISYGLGTLLILISSYIHIELLSNIGSILQSLMGIAIAVGISIGLNLKSIDMLCMIISGSIASYLSSYLIIIYLTVLLSAQVIQLLDTYFNIWLKPLVVIIISTLFVYFFNPYIDSFMIYLGNYFNTQMNNESIIIKIMMSMIISNVMGLLIPILGPTICTSMNLNSIVCGIALSGICSYTIGLTIIGLKDNHIADTFAIAIGTPLLEFPNIIKHPAILIPLIFSSAITGVLSACIFLIEAPSSVSYGLITGIINTVSYNHFAYMSAILLINIAVPLVVCFIISQLLYRFKLIKSGNLKIEHL